MHYKKGFTLMELMIVLAVLAIIAAILIPTFLTTTDRARLRSDIQSAQVINNAMELYRSERGRNVAGNSATMAEVLTALHTAGYLRAMQPHDTQTDGAVWALENGRAVVDITASDNNIHHVANNLSVNERVYIAGIRTA